MWFYLFVLLFFEFEIKKKFLKEVFEENFFIVFKVNNYWLCLFLIFFLDGIEIYVKVYFSINLIEDID